MAKPYDFYVVTTPGGTWFGPYDDKAAAHRAQRRVVSGRASPDYPPVSRREACVTGGWWRSDSSRPMELDLTSCRRQWKRRR